MVHGKKYKEALKSFDNQKAYSIAEAVELVKKVSYSKFDSTIELAIKTNANPKYNDQNLRTTIVLPHGTGKSKKIAVFASEDKHDEAKKAGANVVGNENLLNEIKAGKIDFEILVTTPDMMRELAPVAKTLGPKGLMPSPKAGTVTTNIGQAVEEFKKGKIEFRLDKTGNIHAPVGKASFDESQLAENLEKFLQTIEDNKPSGVKGKLIKKVVITPTMWPGIMVDYIGK